MALKNIVFLAPANGIKPSIVIKRLLNNDFFIKNYNYKFVTDSEKGRLNNLIKYNNLSYQIWNKEKPLLNSIKNLGNSEIDYIISCGWGYKIPLNVIELANIASLNCHSSFLPDYKGGSVYNMQWANLEENGGASVHFLTEEFDAGKILTQEKFTINIKDSPKDILVKASELTSVLIREALVLTELDYDGFKNSGGRYFIKTNKSKLYLHRIVNMVLYLFGSDKRWITKWK